jgi:CheY-like chemotaxis protein
MPGSLYPLTVLIVDDHPDTAESLARVVNLCGYDAHTAYTPTEAVLATDADPPDVLFLDIALPGMDGYRLAKKLCDRLARKPLLVAITGFQNLEDRSKAEGFDHHFLKPADPTRLVAALSAHGKLLAGIDPSP